MVSFLLSRTHLWWLYFLNMKQLSEEKEDFYALILSELKLLGVKIPKIKKSKLGSIKQVLYEKSQTKIFGVSLSEQEWITENECTLPKFLSIAINYLRNYKRAEIGLFRKAGSVVRQRKLRSKLENGGNLDESEPNDVASLLKQWLRELPEPLIPCHLHDLFFRSLNLDDEEARLLAVLLTCLLLPCEHIYTLKHLFLFLSEIAANSEKNKMVPHNLAVIMAPNLLFGICDRSDYKTGNDLVQSHTALVELLILNAEKIGEIPAGISTKLALKVGELESSVETSCCSPSKLKKKRKGTGVIDIMCGIRRFVGGNVTHLSDDTLEMSDLQPNSVPAFGFEFQSTSKRKAGHDVCDSSEKIRKPVGTKSEVHETWLFTPVGKNSRFFNSLAVPTVTHSSTRTRRKSFGLLRKKQHKRTKSAAKVLSGFKHSNVIVSVLCSQLPGEVKEPVSQVKESKSMNTLIVPKPVDSQIGSYTSPNMRINNSTIKRAISDCYVNIKVKEVTPFSKYMSSSYGDLTKKKISSTLRASMLIKRHSPRTCMDKKCLIHGTYTGSSNKKDKFSKISSKYLKTEQGSQMNETVLNKSISQNTVQANSEVSDTNTCPNSQMNVKEYKTRKYSTADNIISASNLQMPSNNKADQINVFPDLLIVGTSPVSNTMNRLDSNSNIDSTSEHITYFQEGNKESSETNEIKDFEFKTPNDIFKNNRALNSSTKKGANKHSIRRGRPNTIKTGLPSDICPKYTGDSILICSDTETHTPLFDKVKPNGKKRHSSPNFLFPEEPVFDEVKIKKSLTKEISACIKDTSLSDTSLNTWLDVTQAELKQNDLSISFTPDFSKNDKACDESLNSSTSFNFQTSFSEKKSINDSYVNSRRFPQCSSMSSFENLIEECASNLSRNRQNISNDINIIPPTPSPKSVGHETNENVETEDLKYECEEMWMSANKFVKVHLQNSFTSSENIAACKRESIIQLMVKNAGKVQASVQHYNGISNNSPSHMSNEVSDLFSPSISATPKIKTRSMSLHETASGKPSKKENKLSRRKLQSFKTSVESPIDLKCSIIKKEDSHKKSSVTSPKVYVTNFDTYSPVISCPLKEVTNISKKDSFKKDLSSPFLPLNIQEC